MTDSRLYPDMEAALAGSNMFSRTSGLSHQIVIDFPTLEAMQIARDAIIKASVPAVREFACSGSDAQGSQEGTPSAAGVWFSSLIESLRPFAYYFDLNDCEGRSDGDALEIPVSDLRAARDLLKKLGIDTSLPPWATSLPSTERRPPRFPDAISPEPPENAQ